MGRVVVKNSDVDLGTSFAPAGARILEVLKSLAPAYNFDLVLTSGRDGVHSGPADPHHSGEAFDLRTQGLTREQKQGLLIDLRARLYGTPRRFYVLLESAGTGNEHIHIQRRAGTQYLVLDYLQNL